MSGRGLGEEVGKERDGALPVAVLALAVRTSRKALAPKLMRRANAVLGVVAGAEASASPSSMTLSSSAVEPEPALEALSRRAGAVPKGEVCVGDDPERPRVVMDMRRRFWALTAAVAMDPGKGGVPLLAPGDRPKMPESV